MKCLRNILLLLLITVFIFSVIFIVSCNKDNPKNVVTSESVTNATGTVKQEESSTTITAAQNQNSQDKKISPDQEKLINAFGYPDEYIIVFDETQATFRSEIWTYVLLEKSFFFDNGIYSGSKKVIMDYSNDSSFYIKPEIFNPDMKPLDLNALLGVNADEVTDNVTGRRYFLYDMGRLVFIFNSEDKLTGVSKLLKPVFE